MIAANTKVNARGQAFSREVRLVGWVAPLAGWIKVNTDGASRGNPGLATAGGVLRDGEGNWLGGFGLNIGRCTAPLVELWGVFYGLYLAWEMRATRFQPFVIADQLPKTIYCLCR